MDFRNTEAVLRRCTSEQVFLKIWQCSQKNTCFGAFFNKYPGLKACNFIKKRLQHRCFPVKFAKLLRTPFFTEHIRWLLLEIYNELSLYCIWERWMVLFLGTYWLSSACFILLHVFCFFLFLSFFSYFFVDFTTSWF